MAKPRIELRTIDSSDQGTLEVLVRASFRARRRKMTSPIDEAREDRLRQIAMESAARTMQGCRDSDTRVLEIIYRHALKLLKEKIVAP